MSDVPRFWRESSHRYRLVGTKCNNCGSTFFPPRDVCPKCRRESIGKMEELEFSGYGEVYSYTVVHDGLEPFKFQLPYILAMIKTDEGPLVTGQIVDADPSEVKIGSRVRVTLRRIREEGKTGIIQYGYKFILEK
jgi:Predicted nucleic-acid-binding protein containing a Zn-ribbon